MGVLRRHVAAVGATLLLAAGCASGQPGDSAAAAGPTAGGEVSPSVAASRAPSSTPESPSERAASAVPDRVPSTPRARIGATQPTAAPVSAGRAKLTNWPEYWFDGPADLDVCMSARFPLEGLLYRGDGSEGGTDLESAVIRSAQAGLRSLNYGKPDPVTATGFFGPVTERAVRSFQERKGLTVDGTLGAETWGSLHHWVNAYDGNCP